MALSGQQSQAVWVPGPVLLEYLLKINPVPFACSSAAIRVPAGLRTARPEKTPRFVFLLLPLAMNLKLYLRINICMVRFNHTNWMDV